MKPRSPLHQLKTIFLDLLFPLRCLGCGREGSLICSSCSPSLPTVEPPFCQHCGTPLVGDIRCSACISHPLTIDGIRSMFLFTGTARQAILQFKYKRLKAMAAPLAQLLVGFLHTTPLPGEIVVPVPLHVKQLRRRGYNQASLLVKDIQGLTGLPVAEGVLLRLRDTVSQARTASAAERRRNVLGAFSCPRGLQGENILLIDDVCTTGATLDACARTLKAAGAGSVWGLTVAREVLSPPQKRLTHHTDKPPRSRLYIPRDTGSGAPVGGNN